MADFQKRDEKRGDARSSLQKGSSKPDPSRFRTLASDQTSETRVPKPTSVLGSAPSFLPELAHGDDGETRHCADEFCAGGPEDEDSIFDDSEISESPCAAEEINIPDHRRPIRDSDCDSSPRVRKMDHAALLQALLTEEGSSFVWLAGSGGLQGAEASGSDLFQPLLQEADQQCAEATAHVVVRIHPAANCQQDEGHYKEVPLEEWVKSKLAEITSRPEEQASTAEVEQKLWRSPPQPRRLLGWPEGSSVGSDPAATLRLGGGEARGEDRSRPALLRRRTFRESECDTAPRIRKLDHMEMLRAFLAEESGGPDWLVSSGDCHGVVPSGKDLFPPLVQEADKQCAEAVSHVGLRIHPAANCQQDEGHYKEVALEEWERSKAAEGTSMLEEQASTAEVEPELRRLLGWPEGSLVRGDLAGDLRLGGGETHEKDMSRAVPLAGSPAVAIRRHTFRESECDFAPRIRKLDHMAMLQAILTEKGGEPDWLVNSGECHGAASSSEDLFPPLMQEADKQCAEAVAHVVVRIHPAADFQRGEGHYEEVALEEWERSKAAEGTSLLEEQASTAEVEPKLCRLLGWPEGALVGGDLAGDLRLGGGETREKDMSWAVPLAGSPAVAIRRHTFRESECDFAPRIRRLDHTAMLRAILTEEGGAPDWLVRSGDYHGAASSSEDLFPPLVQEVDEQCAEAIAHVVVRIHPASNGQQDDGPCEEQSLEEWVKSKLPEAGFGLEGQASTAEAEQKIWRLSGWPEGSPAGGDLGEAPNRDMSQAALMAGSAAVALRRSTALRTSSSQSSGPSESEPRR